MAAGFAREVEACLERIEPPEFRRALEAPIRGDAQGYLPAKPMQERDIAGFLCARLAPNAALQADAT